MLTTHLPYHHHHSSFCLPPKSGSGHLYQLDPTLLRKSKFKFSTWFSSVRGLHCAISAQLSLALCDYKGCSQSNRIFGFAGVYLHDSQIKVPTRAAQDMDMAAELWKETERELAEAEKKLTS